MLNFIKKNYYVKLLFLFVLVAILSFCFTPRITYAETQSSSTTSIDWEKSSSPTEIKILNGTSGDEYILNEYSPTGYSIYNKNGNLIERSQQGVSPYFGEHNDLVYGGPTYYFKKHNETTAVDLVRDSEVNNEMLKNTKTLSETKNNFNTRANLVATEKKFVKNSNYIGNLDYDYNDNGTCGYIAASIVLGYYDNLFPSKNFIDPSYRLSNNQLSSDLHSALRNLGKKDSSTADTIKPIVKKYLSSRNVSGVSHFSWLGAFTTNAMLTDSVKKNNPVMIFGSLDDPSGNSPNVTHAVVVYGYELRSYDNGAAFFTYTCHYGWSKSFNAVEVSNNAIDFLVGTSYYLNVK